MLTKTTITSLLILCSFAIIAQNNTVNGEIENIIESITEDMEEGTEAAYILETLERLSENPVDINNAGHRQLAEIPFLNEIQISNLLEYRKQFGPVYSLFELVAVEGFSKTTVEKIEPFIYLGEVDKTPAQSPGLLKNGRHELFLRTTTVTQKPKGFVHGKDSVIPFEGDKFRHYTRYKFVAGDNISAGITGEKDPGEAFLRGSNKYGFDFWSAHLKIKINKLIEYITIGDYNLRCGQGLVIWQGFSTGKSTGILDNSKSNGGIYPFTSTDENRFFRGIGMSLKKGSSYMDIFFSYKKNDANLLVSDKSEICFSSLQNSGYHRTNEEIADKNSLKDLNTGIHVTHRFKNLKTGATFLYRRFNYPYCPADQLYNLFQLNGTNNLVLGSDYYFSKGIFQLYGEAAISKSKGKAFLQGAVANLHDQIQFSLLFRHFGKNYNSLWASAFSESSSVRDETGLYMGIRLLPFKHVTLSAYSDMFRSKWIKYTTAAPLNGYDINIQADCSLSDRITFYVRYKNKRKDKKSTDDKINKNLPEQYKKTRLHFQYKPTKKLTLKSRLEHIFYKFAENEKGWLAFQDIQYSFQRIPVNMTVRLAWFNTDSYNSRIYAYENDLLYAFSIPSFFEEGFRTYINLKYKISKHVEFWMKIAGTAFKDVESVGSGYNEIPGNKKNEVKFQLRLKI